MANMDGVLLANYERPVHVLYANTAGWHHVWVRMWVGKLSTLVRGIGTQGICGPATQLYRSPASHVGCRTVLTRTRASGWGESDGNTAILLSLRLPALPPAIAHAAMATQTLQSLFHLTALGTSVAIAGKPPSPLRPAPLRVYLEQKSSCCRDPLSALSVCIQRIHLLP